MQNTELRTSFYQVRIRGYSVELQAIEAALLNLPSVRSCAVICIGAEGDDKQVVVSASIL